MARRQTVSALEALSAAIDALIATELSSLPATDVTALLAGIEVQKRRLEAVDQRLLTEVSERGIAGEYARTSPTDLLVTLLRVSPGEAKARVARSTDLGPRRALSGEALAPILPRTAAAVAAGEISAGHVDVIAHCLDRVAAIDPAAAPVAEQLLVDAARHEHPRQLAGTARLLLARLDPDGLEPHDAAIERRRGFSLRKHPDGSADAKGLLTAEAVASWEAIFDSLAARVPGDELPDQRSAAQRRHDALADAATRLLRSNTLPAAGGAPVTILARTSMSELQQASGVALTGHGSILSLTQLLAMASDAHLLPVICTDTGGILAYGRSRRLASPAQRAALAARDGGCCFPGCDRPAAWCETHHVQEWIHGGPTDLDNLCLLCRYHHRSFATAGWDVIMTDGVPHWRPPAWLDPHRKPLRNTTHHLTDFDFRMDGAA